MCDKVHLVGLCSLPQVGDDSEEGVGDEAARGGVVKRAAQLLARHRLEHLFAVRHTAVAKAHNEQQGVTWAPRGKG